MRRARGRVAALALAGLSTVLAISAHAGGPLVTTTSGEWVGWDTQVPVPYTIDQGMLGTLSNAAAVTMTNALFDVWENVPTAAIAYNHFASLAVDVDTTNFTQYMGPFAVLGAAQPQGFSPIVFDADGAIFDALYGLGNGVLGFAGPAFFSNGTTTTVVGSTPPTGSRIVEGVAFLNGKWIDGNAANGEMALAEYQAVFIHEFGHFSGLDHTQIHGLTMPVTSDQAGYTSPAETMFPFYIFAGGQGTLGRDDEVALSVMYPETTFGSSTGRITGRVLDNQGAPVSGINVIARNTVDPADAVSYVSNATLVAPGEFSLAGLTPGESYIVEVQEVDAFATGGSRVGPFAPSVILPGPPEAHNGASESADPGVDDANLSDPIVASAGTTVAGVDIKLNFQSYSVRNVLLGGDSQLMGFSPGDYDGDGDTDFVGQQGGNVPGTMVRFYRNDGTGKFTPETIATAPILTFNTVPGHFNAGVDAFLDFAATTIGTNDVHVVFGNGDGTFQPATLLLNLPDLPFGGVFEGFWDLQAGDVNGDAFTDLVALYSECPATGGAAGIHALLGSASGAFTVQTTNIPAVNAHPACRFVLADVQGSPATDIVGVSSSSPAEIAILVGNGGGGFVTSSLPIPSISDRLEHDGGIATGDFDGDGVPDLVLSDLQPTGFPPNFTRSYVDVLLGDGGGGFSLSDRYYVPEVFQNAIVAADMDADGNLDIASAGSGGQQSPGAKITIAYGDGAGGVGNETTIWALAEFPRAIAAADLDGSTGLDLLVSDSVGTTLDNGPQYYSVVLRMHCGDGLIDSAPFFEECDDGNLTDGDGCDSNCTFTVCGNDIVTSGEQCDDGNTLPGDCCSPTCQFEPAGTKCKGPWFKCSYYTCDGMGGCIPQYVKIPDCKGGLLGKVDVANPGDDDPGDDPADKKDAVGWKLSRGDATDVEDLGDPTDDTDYALCVFANATDDFIVGLDIPASATKWRPTSKGFRFSDKLREPDGVSKVTLNAGPTNRTSISVKARGPLVPAMTLGVSAPVTVQLSNSATEVCWESEFDANDILRSDQFRLKAKSKGP